MKNRLNSFACLLPLLELLFGAAIVFAPAFLFFLRLKHMAHGAGGVSLAVGEFVIKIPSDRFLPVALDQAGRWAEKPVTVLNAPAKFVEAFVSLLVAHKANWYPESILSSTWRAVIYPVYALPAWLYVGVGIDALMGRRPVRRWNAALSVFLALSFVVLFCGFRFGIPSADREGQELLSWFIDGFALWAVLFAIPFAAWMLWRRRTRLLGEEAHPK